MIIVMVMVMVHVICRAIVVAVVTAVAAASAAKAVVAVTVVSGSIGSKSVSGRCHVSYAMMYMLCMRHGCACDVL